MTGLQIPRWIKKAFYIFSNSFTPIFPRPIAAGAWKCPINTIYYRGQESVDLWIDLLQHWVKFTLKFYHFMFAVCAVHSVWAYINTAFHDLVLLTEDTSSIHGRQQRVYWMNSSGEPRRAFFPACGLCERQTNPQAKVQLLKKCHIDRRTFTTGGPLWKR
jgi:hypothetical protein